MVHSARGIFALLLTLSLLSGCPTTTSIEGVEGSTVDTMPTVVEVTWTTGSEVAAQVFYGEGSSLDLSTPLGAPATEHRALLLGLPPETTASYQVVTEDGEESEVLEITTGGIEGDVPTFTLDGDDQGHYLLTPLYRADTYDGAAAILDGQGRTVWQKPDDRGLYVSRVRLARDGSGVIYNSSDLNGRPEEEQTLIWVNWEGEEVRTEYVPLMGHDFVEKADGTIVTVAFHEQDDFNGTKLVEIAPDGTQTDTWTTFDCFDPKTTGHDEMEMGWTFANAMDYDEAADKYTISFRNLGSIVSVDGATGTCDWALGGTTNTFEITGGTFEHQHQFVRGEDTMLVFDNDGQVANSRIIEYAMDYGAETAEEIWSYELGQWNVVLGDVHRLDDGDTLAIWAVYGTIERVTPAGEVEATLQADGGVVIGFTELEDDLYTP